MASESTDGRSESLDLPPDVDEWLDERAADLDVDRDELVAQLLGAHHTVATEGVPSAVLDEAVGNALDRQLGALRSEFGSELDDIRRRVVQLKEATDQRAPADHSHTEFEELDEFETRLDEIETRLDELADAVEKLQVDRDEEAESEPGVLPADAVVDDGRLDDLEGKLTRVASAVVALQREHADAAAPADEREAERLADIQRHASREGIESANCVACGETVSIGLLPEGACPHCGAEFASLEPSEGFFAKPRLVDAGGRK